ncbi:MAG: hypothetical protein B6D58_03190 [candidate division Zixibacteria bacterium 4484_95]|nr:MAG: hypothetical protein B6D58_03190 [candidate division Zixibacteria bacterium 4484_95]
MTTFVTLSMVYFLIGTNITKMSSDIFGTRTALLLSRLICHRGTGIGHIRGFHEKLDNNKL